MNRPSPALPPGPPANVLAQTVALHRDPLGFLRDAQSRFGDLFTLRLLTVRPLAVVADPAAAARLLDADPGRALAGEARREVLPFASPRSVFGGDREAHRLARARVAPAFCERAMIARRPAMAAIAERHVATWPRGSPFRLLPRMRTICDEIFVRLVLGVREERLARQLIAAIRRMLLTPGNPPTTLPGRGDGLLGELGEALFRRRRAPVAHCLGRAVEARRGEPRGGDGDGVLDLVLAAEPRLDTEAIVEELLSLLMAAQEPPSIALTWLLDRLAREPRERTRFRAEPTGEAGRALIAETLRLQPPASAALRRLTEPLELHGCELPPGLDVMVPTSLIHRDGRCFERPDEFVPERWGRSEPPAGTYFPFGGGARRCVGEQLARAEIASVLPAVLDRVRLAPLAEQPEPMVQRATVLVPKRSLLVRAESRA